MYIKVSCFPCVVSQGISGYLKVARPKVSQGINHGINKAAGCHGISERYLSRLPKYLSRMTLKAPKVSLKVPKVSRSDDSQGSQNIYHFPRYLTMFPKYPSRMTLKVYVKALFRSVYSSLLQPVVCISCPCFARCIHRG
jgi:hypothetical protein